MCLCDYQPPHTFASVSFKSVHTSYQVRHYDFAGSRDDYVNTFKITFGNDHKNVDIKYQSQ